MPIYMKFTGITGPITHNDTKGWIELESVQLGVLRNVGGAPGQGADREAPAPRPQEIVATKNQDSTSAELFKQALWGEGKDVTIVLVKNPEGGKTEEIVRIKLKNALISSYSTSGHGGPNSPPLESFTLNAISITFEKGSPAHASLMVQPRDWGTMEAVAEFSRTAIA